MPLTSKGEEIKSNMEKEYGPKKGEQVFYASANKGTIKGVHDMPQAKDVEDPKPASGPMSTNGPAAGAKSEGLPVAAGVRDNAVGKSMSVKDIKDCYSQHSMDKRR